MIAWVLLVGLVPSPGCAKWSSGRTVGPLSEADSLQLAIVIFTTAVEHGTRTSYRASHPRLVCVAHGVREWTDPPEAVLAHLREIDSLIVQPISACEQQPLDNAPPGPPLIVDPLTGRRGIRVSASDPRFAADGSFTVELGYYEHGLSAAGWTCTGRRLDGGWEITECRMDWIS